MIDFIKFKIQGTGEVQIRKLIESKQIGAICTEKNNLTDKTSTTYTLKNMNIKPIFGGVVVWGSLHKFHSQIIEEATPQEVQEFNGYNGYNFTIKEVKKTALLLCDLLGVRPDECKVQGVEFGLNISVPFVPFNFLVRLIAHRNNYTPQINYNSNFYQFKHEKYFLKLYSKSNQYKRLKDNNINILRVEIKIKKTHKLHQHKIYLNTLQDLQNDNIYILLLDLLIKELSSILLVENIDTKKINIEEINFIKEFANPLKWKQLPRMKRSRAKKKLKALNDTHGKGLIKDIKERAENIFYNLLK